MEVSKLTINNNTPSRTMTNTILKWVVEHPQFLRNTNAQILTTLMLPDIKREFPDTNRKRVYDLLTRWGYIGVLQKVGGHKRKTFSVDVYHPKFPASLISCLPEDVQAKVEEWHASHPVLPKPEPSTPTPAQAPMADTIARQETMPSVELSKDSVNSISPLALSSTQPPITIALSISLAINGVPVNAVIQTEQQINESNSSPLSTGVSEGLLPSTQKRPIVSEQTEEKR